MLLYVVLALLCIGFASSFILRRCLLWSKIPRNYLGQHVVITGGSSGIGRALAERFAREGAHVTIIARNKEKLEEAEKAIRAARIEQSQKVQSLSADVGSYEEVIRTLDVATRNVGEVDVLVACAGGSTPGYFNSQDISIFEQCMRINYFGSLYCAKVVAPKMVERRRGHIIFIGSALSVISFAGYSSYAPTKWAVRGLADSLRNELGPYGVRISMSYPADTDTPGFEQENLSKPKETFEISPPSLYSAEKVVEGIFLGIKRGSYHLPSPDPLTNLLVSSMSGVSPRERPLRDIILGPLEVIGCILFCWNADRIAAKYVRR
mmetsp:Transcript_17348/g.28487  ORF Transcript_17348/g.28487 Transcript_17348/m.28487 type:complete len:321 (-) Transcript_17348:530-1492(-)|eukprot:CAMPEP_0184352090 /NCGR_PEP_ID=MMETSP1089-20130417/60170_1 /TAXON_ID=38269 ORGANISM="Gloeochaete wittrockiana, Strain SAG46.84" /NCGR_SAMPLE_ID=MMETSP1089 /ASSEMBLY_ACC=CAM_ASM_000445 /LENGTH=320 /DNA_ID=CAMNT_0026686171 /DNA_START=20 /DNA_END=982 /DNA_ORIENTATION=+